MIVKVLALAHSQHVRLQAETDPLIRSFEEASSALKDGNAAHSSIFMRFLLRCCLVSCAEHAILIAWHCSHNIVTSHTISALLTQF
jgi:hypothetical protein